MFLYRSTLYLYPRFVTLVYLVSQTDLQDPLKELGSFLRSQTGTGVDKASFADNQVSGADGERDFSVYCYINGCAWECMLCRE